MEEEPSSQQLTPSPSAHPPSYSEIPGTVPLNQSVESGPPPAYEDVINPEAPPPSYQSLFGQVREARKNSSNVIEFLRKVVIILLGTIGCSIMIGVTIVIPISMIAIGAKYIGECPVEKYIPVYLVVGGIFWAGKNLVNCLKRCRRTQNQEESLHNRPHDSLLNCFLVGWFVAGCCWIYRVYEPEYEDYTSPLYCNKTLYLFAFWLVTSTFIIIGLMSVFLICFVASSVITSLE